MFKKLKFCLGLVLSGVLLYASMQMVDFREICLALGRTNYAWVILSGTSMILSFVCRGYLSQKILSPNKEISLSTAFGAVVVGNMANNILPLRLGELARAYLLGRWEQLGLSSVISAILIERLLDVIILALLFALTVPLVPWEGPIVLKAVFLTMATVGLLAIIFWVVKEKGDCCKAYQVLLSSFGLGVLSWLWWSLALAAALLALNIQGPLVAMTLVLMVVLNLAVLLPSSPGSIGIFQFAAIYGLKMFGVSPGEAFSLSLVFQGINYLLTLGLGAWFAWQAKVNLVSIWKMGNGGETGKGN